MGLIECRPGDVRRAGSGRESGMVSFPRPLLFFSPDPARPAPAFSIDPTDREPGTGYLDLSASVGFYTVSFLPDSKQYLTG